jgi:hypothetical protein
MGGLTAATVLTLIVLPCLYAASYRVREAAHGAMPATTVTASQKPGHVAHAI